MWSISEFQTHFDLETISCRISFVVRKCWDTEEHRLVAGVGMVGPVTKSEPVIVATACVLRHPLGGPP